VIKVYQLLAHGQWFSPGTPISSTTKTGRHNIAENGVKHYIKSNIVFNSCTNLLLFQQEGISGLLL
jgi:hypothetical protein